MKLYITTLILLSSLYSFSQDFTYPIDSIPEKNVLDLEKTDRSTHLSKQTTNIYSEEQDKKIESLLTTFIERDPKGKSTHIKEYTYNKYGWLTKVVSTDEIIFQNPRSLDTSGGSRVSEFFYKDSGEYIIVICKQYPLGMINYTPGYEYGYYDKKTGYLVEVNMGPVGMSVQYKYDEKGRIIEYGECYSPFPNQTTCRSQYHAYEEQKIHKDTLVIREIQWESANLINEGRNGIVFVRLYYINPKTNEIYFHCSNSADYADREKIQTREDCSGMGGTKGEIKYLGIGLSSHRKRYEDSEFTHKFTYY